MWVIPAAAKGCRCRRGWSPSENQERIGARTRRGIVETAEGVERHEARQSGARGCRPDGGSGEEVLRGRGVERDDDGDDTKTGEGSQQSQRLETDSPPEHHWEAGGQGGGGADDEEEGSFP